MGTRFNMLLPGIDPPEGEELFIACIDELNRLEKKLSCFIADSEISMINNKATNDTIELDDELFGILEDCRKYHELTGGSFDISLGEVIDRWKSGPRGIEQDEFYHEAGFDKIILDRENKTIQFTSPIIKLDLGGYGKGYALNRIRDILSKSGITSALISFGESTVCCIGTHPFGDHWPIGIPDHYEKNIILETLKLENEAVSTSGNLDNPDHIIDPVNGFPVKGKKTVTVKSGSAVRSEVLSTALMITDEETRDQILQELAGIEILEVNYKDKKPEVLTYSSKQ